MARLTTALVDRYTIEGELGAGGMATVYLAQDIKHDRKVAIKVLRPELAAVIGAERFLSEIKTTANLQHPHILPLFDSGEADSFLFYVMPFVQGETLRDRIDREKQLPVADGVRIAREIAAALDYAHRHGVIHRDIKPENILLHDGSALVADFGIALAASKASDTRMTETGMSLGTPHYMSPEQAMGEREITARSDVYALGAVLYEVLTGDPPFSGSTAQAIIARVVTESPRGMTTQRHTIPHHVEAAVFTALEKLPADRFATAAEFAEALTNQQFSTTAGMAAVPGAASSSSGFAARAGWAVALLAVGVALWGWLRPDPSVEVSRQRVVLWKSAFPDQLSPSSPRIETRMAISPDGNTIVFADSVGDDTQLFLKRRGDARPSPIEGTVGGAGPFFSPDGQWIGYFAPGAELRKVQVAGGGSVLLSDNTSEIYLVGTWLEDGTVVFKDAGSGLSKVSGEGGPTEVYRETDALHRDDPSTLSPLPGSRGVLFTGCPGNCASGSALFGYDIEADTIKLLVPDALGGWYAPSGHLLYTSRDGGLYAVGFDAEKLEITSGAISIVDNVAPGEFAMSAGGTALYAIGTADLQNSSLMWVGRDGTEEPLDSEWTGAFEYPAVSPDGKTVAVSIREQLTQLWVRRADGSRLQVSNGEQGSWRPAWTPDGKAFAFATTGGISTTDAGNDVYLNQLDGGTPPELFVDIPNGLWEVEFSRDGEWVVMRADDGASFGAIHVKRLQGDTAVTLIHADSSFNTQISLSPDSKWLAFSSDRSGMTEVYVASFPDMAVKYPVSQAGGNEPRWSRSGRELFFKSRGRLMSLPVGEGIGFAPGSARELFSVAPYAYAANRPMYDVGPEDQRFLMIRRPDAVGQQEVVVVEGFLRDLEARMKQ